MRHRSHWTRCPQCGDLMRVMKKRKGGRVYVKGMRVYWKTHEHREDLVVCPNEHHNHKPTAEDKLHRYYIPTFTRNNVETPSTTTNLHIDMGKNTIRSYMHKLHQNKDKR